MEVTCISSCDLHKCKSVWSIQINSFLLTILFLLYSLDYSQTKILLSSISSVLGLQVCDNVCDLRITHLLFGSNAVFLLPCTGNQLASSRNTCLLSCPSYSLWVPAGLLGEWIAFFFSIFSVLLWLRDSLQATITWESLISPPEEFLQPCVYCLPNHFIFLVYLVTGESYFWKNSHPS